MALGRDIYHDFPAHPPAPPPVAPGAVERVPIAIVGAGPVGLTLAAGLAAHGVRSVLLEARDSVSFGSRATCISRRSLEIWDRFGVAGGVLAKGLGWTAGRSFWRDHHVLRFEMPNAPGDKHPPMVNIQQCFAEHLVLQDLARRPECELRWHSTVLRATPGERTTRLDIATPEGSYGIEADWVVATDGARSSLREAVGLKLEGDSYEGRYLIADIRLRSKHPTERRAWFDPASNRGSTVLMHKQPDDIWRIDYQLRDDEDPDAEVQEARVRARISAHLAMIGEPPEYDLIWISLYRAHTLTLPRYRAGRVLFAGDAAHLVPIFGVRGLNSGIDDAGNLAWKLAAVVQGEGTEALLDSYSEERVHAARENIRQSRKSTLFMTPPSAGFALMRDAALSLAVSHDFARPLINPRQTTAITFPESRLQTADDAPWPAGPVPGATVPNLPLPAGGHLLDHLATRPLLLLAADEPLPVVPPGLDTRHLDPATAATLGLGARGFYLIRPDGHVAARRHALDGSTLDAALRRLMGTAP